MYLTALLPGASSLVGRRSRLIVQCPGDPTTTMPVDRKQRDPQTLAGGRASVSFPNLIGLGARPNFDTGRQSQAGSLCHRLGVCVGLEMVEPIHAESNIDFPTDVGL